MENEELEALLALRRVTSKGDIPKESESGEYDLDGKLYSKDFKTCLSSSGKFMSLKELVVACKFKCLIF